MHFNIDIFVFEVKGIHEVGIVCTPPPFCWGKGGWTSNQIFKKGGGLDRTLVFRGELLVKRGWLFSGGCNFLTKNKLKSGIFNDKKMGSEGWRTLIFLGFMEKSRFYRGVSRTEGLGQCKFKGGGSTPMHTMVDFLDSCIFVQTQKYNWTRLLKLMYLFSV